MWGIATCLPGFPFLPSSALLRMREGWATLLVFSPCSVAVERNFGSCPHSAKRRHTRQHRAGIRTLLLPSQSQLYHVLYRGFAGGWLWRECRMPWKLSGNRQRSRDGNTPFFLAREQEVLRQNKRPICMQLKLLWVIAFSSSVKAAEIQVSHLLSLSHLYYETATIGDSVSGVTAKSRSIKGI